MGKDESKEINIVYGEAVGFVRWYEYQAFRVEVPFVPDICFASARVEDWPNQESQDILLERMNALGGQGWEIFEMSRYPNMAARDPQEWPRCVVYNLWARRELGWYPGARRREAAFRHH
jgi:hypothetical protein